MVDISYTREQVEAALGERDRRTRTLETLGVVTWSKSPSGPNVVGRQPAWLPFTGPPSDEARADGWTGAAHPHDLIEATAKWREAVARGAPFESELRICGDDGQWRWMNVRGAPIRDEKGDIVEWFGVNIDITDRKRAEDALRQSGELNRRALQAFPVHVAVIDRNGHILATNQAWDEFARQNAAGDLPSVAVGANYLDACRRAVDDDDVAAWALGGIEAVMDGRRSQFTMEYPCHSAQEQRWFLMTVAPLDSSGEVGAVIAHADITERIKAKELLEHTRSQLAEAQRIAHLGSWEYDTTTGTTIWSDEEKRIYGLDPAGPSPDYDTLLRHHIHPDDAPEFDQLFRAALERGGTFQSEQRIILPNGSVRWIYDKAHPYFDDRGRLSRYVGATLDITERRAADAALREADRRKDEFLATLAHELRNPLAPIMNGLHILQLGRVDETRAAQVRDMVSRQINHLVRLVDDLMEVSRISQGKIELRKKRIDLTEILNDAVASSQPLIAELEHRLTIVLPRKPLLLHADPTRLAQVFTNLLNNAAKFTKPGGQIELSARSENGEVVVSVRDNGVGIPPDRLPQIFELFTQLGGPLDPARAGLGIGLGLARGLAELHGGRVEAHSEGLGRGSEFTLRLPLADANFAQISAEAAIGSATSGVPRRVLVVDDNRDAANTLSLLLEALNADVRVAYDGPSALEIVPAFKPEVVFMDLGMPQMDGFETVRRLRELDEGRGLLLIALTGWSQKEDRRKSLEAGFDRHLVKPIDLDVLKALLVGATESKIREN